MSRIFKALQKFGAFWVDFVVGEDWRVAAGVVAALGATAILSAFNFSAWWLPPVAAIAILAISLKVRQR